MESTPDELRFVQRTMEDHQARRASLAAPPGGTPTNETGVRACEDALALEALEHSLACKRLEVMECQVAKAEDALASREARIQWEVGQKVAGICKALVEEYHHKVELQEARFKWQRVELRGQYLYLI